MLVFFSVNKSIAIELIKLENRRESLGQVNLSSWWFGTLLGDCYINGLAHH